jgi:hypothetical protein
MLSLPRYKKTVTSSAHTRSTFKLNPARYILMQTLEGTARDLIIFISLKPVTLH